MAICGAVATVALSAAAPRAQPVFRGTEIFPAEEFAARRARVMARIGDGVAIVLGATEPPGELPFRQNNQSFYLTGVVEPRADRCASTDAPGRRRCSCSRRIARRDTSMFGPALAPGPEAAKDLGVECRAAARADSRPR